MYNNVWCFQLVAQSCSNLCKTNDRIIKNMLMPFARPCFSRFDHRISTLMNACKCMYIQIEKVQRAFDLGWQINRFQFKLFNQQLLTTFNWTQVQKFIHKKLWDFQFSARFCVEFQIEEIYSGISIPKSIAIFSLSGPNSS